MKSIRELVFTYGSVKSALPWIEREGFPAETMAVLQEVSDALSDLQALRGRAGDKSKIKAGQVEKIKKLLRDGKSLSSVAKETGVSTATVHRYSKAEDMVEFYRSQRAKLLMTEAAKGLSEVLKKSR